jgi:glutamine kinase
MRIEFGSKGETLERVASILTSARVLPQFRFTAAAWRSERDRLLQEASHIDWLTGSASLIVRSAAAGEDVGGHSLAGHYRSVLSVPMSELAQAIDHVVDSFGGIPSSDDQVFVQPMLQAALVGVAFTRDPNTGSPYLVINYERGGDTSAITAGKTNTSETYIYWKGGAVPAEEPLDRVVALCGELEDLFDTEWLDLEFAIDTSGDLFLFQVRPLVRVEGCDIALDEHREMLSRIADKIDQMNRPHPYLCGRRTLYGVMPDWNPAEIIGIRPRPLALSLYRQLITDHEWAYQRDNYGYRNLRSFPLMLSFNGLPYIDVRLSFNSFIPGDVSDSLATRLVDAYTDQLSAAPVLHDKIEFEIVFSCYTFDLKERLRRLLDYGFVEHELEDLSTSLRKLTNRIIHTESGIWRTDAAKIEILRERQETIRNSDMDPVGRLYWLMEDCKRYGTLPFAGLARAGFVAVQMLKSLVAVEAITLQQYDSMLAGLETVGGRMSRDLRNLTRGEFLAKYGHLRPGTYDILSLRYDEDPDRYIGVGPYEDAPPRPSTPFALELSQINKISAMLDEQGLEMDVAGLFEFIQAGIEGREHAKFVFTRSVSDMLSILSHIGERYGFDRGDMSYFDASQILALYATSGDAAQLLGHSIALGKERYAEAEKTILPPLLSKPEDVWAFAIPPSEPNFVTQGVSEGHVSGHEESPTRLRGAIVMIPSADPGFDWVFSCGIAGLVTAYGGVNSHMAIRAGELNLPAVIGSGEKLFDEWKRANRIRLDCKSRRVEVIS